MAKRRLERRRLGRWGFVAVAVCGGALALMTLGGCAGPAVPLEGPPSGEAGGLCGTSNQAHLYIIYSDQGIPQKFKDNQVMKTKWGESVLFVNPSERKVTVEPTFTAETFKVFNEAAPIVLGPHQTLCRTIPDKGDQGKKIGKVKLLASYEEPATVAVQSVAMAMSAAGTMTRPTPTKPPSSAIIKPLGGPGMDID